MFKYSFIAFIIYLFPETAVKTKYYFIKCCFGIKSFSAQGKELCSALEQEDDSEGSRIIRKLLSDFIKKKKTPLIFLQNYSRNYNYKIRL